MVVLLSMFSLKSIYLFAMLLSSMYYSVDLHSYSYSIFAVVTVL